MPSFATAAGVSPSLCPMPESPFGCELLKALPSLPGRLTLLLPGGETSGLLSRSVWVAAGLFPVCFLFLATMVSRGEPRRGGEGAVGEKEPWGVWAKQPHSCSYLVLGSAPFTTWAMPPLVPRFRRSEKSDEAAPPTGRLAPLQRASGDNHGNARQRVP